MALPYPKPTSAAVTAAMKANRKANTKPEPRLRSALHRRGLRFRLGVSIAAGDVRVIPDVVFRRARLAVFVDGCWWHRCPEHGVTPKSNTAYWLPKLSKNVERDRRVNAALGAEGWTVVRAWEHQVNADADGVAAMVATVISRG